AGTAGTYVFDAATDQDDGDAARLTYNAVQINSGSSALPTGVSFDGPTRTFTFAASLTAPLEATIQVTASDGSLTSSPQTFTLQVRSASAVGSTGRAVADDSGLVALSRSTREVEFDVRLSVEPQSKAVTLTITSMDASDVSIMPATMEFDDTDWNVVQKATARLEDVDTKGDRVVAMQIAVYNKATSDGYYTNSQDLNVNITVANANAAPVFDLDAIAAIDFSIDETEGKTTVGGSGADLGTPVVATDADNDDATELVYSLVGASSQFAIDAGTGQLSAVAVANLNYERQSSHELVVQVSDGETSGDPGVDEGIAMVTVTVGINNVDEKPSAYNSSSFQVDGAGRNDITLSWNNNDFEAEFDAEDRDAVVILYEGGGYSGVEVLEATVTMFVLGGLVPGVSYDIDITWQTVDSISQDTPEGVQGGNQTTAANAAPVLGGVTFSRAENEGTAVTPAGTVVATVSATDDDGDALTYSIRGGADAGLFVIDAQGGEVRLARSVNFDRETKASYTFNVAATDAYGAMSAAGALVLNITAVDEDPALPLQYAQTATEGVERMFMVRGAAEATDPEGESGSVQFQASLVGGDVLHPWLTLDRATGQFTVGRDSVAGTYNILVRAVFVPSISSLVAPAGGGPVALNVISERMFVLEVQASGSTNTAPDFSSATTEFMIAENSEQDAGETVGTVAAADGQTAASALVYSLRGDDAAGFAIGANGALVIGASAVTFDRESKQEYNFVVDVVDGDGGLASTEVEVEITNVDEAPEFPAIAQRSFQVLARAQSTFFAPQAFDPEGSAVTYTASNPGSWLTFDAMKAEFTVGVSAPPGSHRVTITASDGSLTSEHQFMVQVQTAGNSPPVIMNSVAGVLALPGFVLDSSGTTLAEGTEIGRVVATDDVDGDLTYVMVDDGVSRPFDIDSETGVIEVVDDSHNCTAQVSLVTVGVFDEQGGISWVDVRIEFAVRVLAPRPPATVAPAGAQQQDEVAAVVMDRAMAVATADMLRARLDVPVPASSGAALLYQSKDENALSLLRMASAVDQWQDWRSPESGSIADHGERMKWRDFLSARGFDLALDDGGGRGGVRGRLWGSGSNSTVDGDPILGNLQVVYDGDVKTYLMGLDLVMADNRLGIAFGQSQAELMLGSGKDVHVERDLNLVHPYLSFGLSRNVRIWATGGYGTGDYIRIDASGASEQKTTRKSSYLSAAGGVEGNLVTDKSFEVVVGVQALAVRSALEGVTAALSLPETDASFWRAQADIESSWSFNLLGDVALRPFFGAHLRHDDGDDWLSDDAFDTSAGMSLNWLGLRAEFSSRSQGNEERYDASISYDYAMDGRGLMLSVSPSIAGSDGELSDRSMSSRFDYVLPVRLFGESGVATFNAGFSATETSLAEDYGFRFAGRRLDVGLGAADGSYRIDFTVR
ncbi:MAG: cadherin domain-containing protein, partial [Betaproteobacteria bacterium]|nr:cadherin domain-containing protein [Betaproteobacteria bacterium]